MPINRKAKGTNAERDLIRKFWERGWAAVRVAGSGSSQYPSPDLLVGKNGRRLAIECKITADTKKYFSKPELHFLNYFSKTFGAEIWVAIKFPRQEWVFFLPEDLVDTGKSLAASVELIESKGLNFEELVDEE